MISVAIRGPVSKIQAARQRLLGLLSLCDQQSVIVPVPDRVLPAVVGRKGATVQMLRDQYREATIDVDWALCCVKIHSVSDEERQAVQDEIERIVEQNFSVEVPLDADLSIGLKGNRYYLFDLTLSVCIVLINHSVCLCWWWCRGAETRKQISDLGVNMEMDSSSELVRLRGPRAAVYDAANALQTFIENNYSADLALDLDDESALLSGGEKSLIHSLQRELGVEIHILRKLHIAKLRGPKDSVDAALERLSKVMHVYCERMHYHMLLMWLH